MNKIYKKSISLLLAAALLFTALPFGTGFIAAANFIPEGFTPIHTADELEGIGNNAGGCYILMNDIDLSGSSLYPLALDFSGTLDGNGFTVSNFSLLAQEGYIGLLGRNRGTVKNLNITNCSITSYTSYIGCIAALNCGSIFNCNVEASIDYSLSTSCLDIEVYCGFITGDNANAGTVSHCSSQGNLSISARTLNSLEIPGTLGPDYIPDIYEYLGGIAGRNMGNLFFCRSSAYINAVSDSAATGFDEGGLKGSWILTHAGGITGENSNGTISECYNSGNITIKADTACSYENLVDDATAQLYMGGITGLLNNEGIICNSYNTGTMSGDGNNNGNLSVCAGGIAGFNDNSYIENTYSNTYVSYFAKGSGEAELYIDRISGRNLQGSLTNCYWDFTDENKSLEETYEGFDFEYIWTIDAETNCGYPQLIDNSEYISIIDVSFNSLPARLRYYQFEKLILLDTTLKITYSNGTDEFIRIIDVSKDMVAPVDMTTPGEKTVVVEYFGHTISFDINVVEIALTSICIKSMPLKTIYYQGEQFDSSGLIVTAVYNNGETENVSGYTMSSVDTTTAGMKKVYVTYNGFSALFSVFVLPLTVAGIEIETPPHKLTYNCGENLDTDGLVICVIYNSGRRNYITQGYSVSYDFGSPGTKSVEVSYLGKTASFEVEVKPVEYEAKFVADGVTVATIRYTGETISIIEPEVPKKQGYVGSWESYELAAGGVTVNAVYTPVEYEAKFVADGITVATIRYTVETISIIEPEVPKKQGYVGSWESYELAAGGITVNAVYSEIKAESVSISSPSKTVRYNQTIALSAQVSPAGFLDNRILWESSDASIASVDENGIVTGISNGTITITATVIDNKGNPVLGSDASPVSDSIELTVTMSFLQKAWRWLGILAQALASIFGF